MAELSALDALLGASIEVTDTVRIKRLGVDFEIKAITGDVLAAVREQATYPEGTGKNRKLIVKEDEVGRLLIAKSVTSPNFNDAKLLAHYKAVDAGDCVQKALLAGEIATLQQAVLELSGFGGDDEVEEIKN